MRGQWEAREGARERREQAATKEREDRRDTRDGQLQQDARRETFQSNKWATVVIAVATVVQVVAAVWAALHTTH